MSDQPTLEALTAQIAALSDEQAVQVLALAVYRDRAPTPMDPQLEAHLREAAQGSETATLAAQPAAWDGDLARATLRYLADVAPEGAGDVQRAITVTSDDPTERFIDPASLIIGGLVLLALQTEVRLDRDQQGRWRFRFHKQPMRDSTLGAVLGKLISTYTPPSSQ
jgi:hypothetical protein